MTNLNDVLDPLFAASHPDVMARTTIEATLPVAFLTDVYAAEENSDILSAYARWTRRIIGSENCTISLMQPDTSLKMLAISGDKTIETDTVRALTESAIGAVVLRKQGLYVPCLADIPVAAAQTAAKNGFQCSYVAPIVAGETCFGTLAASFRVASVWPARVLTVIEAMALCIGSQMLLIEQMTRLRDVALTDPLTGTNNRRALDEATPLTWEKWEKEKVPFAVLALDIDHFKSVNDNHGHAVGDEILKQMALRIMDQVRDGDMVVRLGGEEFGVLLPRTKYDTSLQVAERIHTAIRSTPFRVGDLILPLTASFGVTEIATDDLCTEDVLERADQALYAAKRSGRDCVIRFDHTRSISAA